MLLEKRGALLALLAVVGIVVGILLTGVVVVVVVTVAVVVLVVAVVVVWCGRGRGGK